MSQYCTIVLLYGSSGAVSYYAQASQLDTLGKVVANNEYITADSVDYWYFGYETWRTENCKFFHSVSQRFEFLSATAIPKPGDEAAFSSSVRLFLNTHVGLRYQSDVKFEGDNGPIMVCRQ